MARELLKETVPNLSRVAMLWNPEGALSTIAWKETRLPARALGLQLYSIETRRADDFDKAFEEATKARVGAVAFGTNALGSNNMKRVADLAIRRRLPSIYGIIEFVKFGGLMAYGPDRSDLFRRAASM